MGSTLTLNPLTWKIWWAPNNASKWQMEFNSAFKGLRYSSTWGRVSSSVWNKANERRRYLRNFGTKYQLHGVTRQKTVCVILVLGTVRTSNNFTYSYQGFQNERTNKRGCKYSTNSHCYYRFIIGSTRRGSMQGRSRTSGPVSFQITCTPLT
jgi:hypothetical protein